MLIWKKNLSKELQIIKNFCAYFMFKGLKLCFRINEWMLAYWEFIDWNICWWLAGAKLFASAVGDGNLPLGWKFIYSLTSEPLINYSWNFLKSKWIPFPHCLSDPGCSFHWKGLRLLTCHRRRFWLDCVMFILISFRQIIKFSLNVVISAIILLL